MTYLPADEAPPPPRPTRPNPSIIGDPWWGCPRCVICGGHFHGDDVMVAANRWLFWRRWLRRFRHEGCAD